MKDIVLYGLKNFYGIEEIVGKKHNPTIVKFFHDIGHTWVNNDETAWCAAIHSYLLMKCGYKYTGKLNARSWEQFGQKLHKPEFGCTVVFWRVSKDSGFGHVGTFIREEKDWIWVLGGNQSNRYDISKYSKLNLLSYRKIPKMKKDEEDTKGDLGVSERKEEEHWLGNLMDRIGTEGLFSKPIATGSIRLHSTDRSDSGRSRDGTLPVENRNVTEDNPHKNKSEREVEGQFKTVKVSFSISKIINYLRRLLWKQEKDS